MTGFETLTELYKLYKEDRLTLEETSELVILAEPTESGDYALWKEAEGKTEDGKLIILALDDNGDYYYVMPNCGLDGCRCNLIAVELLNLTDRECLEMEEFLSSNRDDYPDLFAELEQARMFNEDLKQSLCLKK